MSNLSRVGPKSSTRATSASASSSVHGGADVSLQSTRVGRDVASGGMTTRSPE